MLLKSMALQKKPNIDYNLWKGETNEQIFGCEALLTDLISDTFGKQQASVECIWRVLNFC